MNPWRNVVTVLPRLWFVPQEGMAILPAAARGLAAGGDRRAARGAFEWGV